MKNYTKADMIPMARIKRMNRRRAKKFWSWLRQSPATLQPMDTAWAFCRVSIPPTEADHAHPLD